MTGDHATPTGPPDWVADAVFYQIFPDRFAASDRVPKFGPLEAWGAPPTRHGFKGGDLLGVVEHLDYLSDLGVTALYLNPIVTSAANHRYHAYDYLHVDPLLGGDAAFRELLAACHARGMRVILDGVFNHSGRGFWPFHHVLETGAASPYRDWFHFDPATLSGDRALRPYPAAGQPRTEDRLVREHSASRVHRAGARSLADYGYLAWFDLPALPKLNTDNPAVREYLFRVAEHWIGLGADGWRLDVPTEIPDPEFWREFRRRVKAVNPDAYLVGEIWHEAPDWLSGARFDGLMNYPLALAIIGFVGAAHLDASVIAEQFDWSRSLRPLDANAFAAALKRLSTTYPPETVRSQLNLLGSHDVPRLLTTCSGDVASVRLATLLQMTLPGAPCVYYGDELGLVGRADPDCRPGFPWEPSAWDTELHAFVRSAIALRHAHPALRQANLRVVAAAGPAIAYLRSDVESALVVGINAGDAPCRLSLDAPELAGRTLHAVLPDDARAVTIGPDGAYALDVPARSGLVLADAT